MSMATHAVSHQPNAAFLVGETVILVDLAHLARIGRHTGFKIENVKTAFSSRTPRL